MSLPRTKTLGEKKLRAIQVSRAMLDGGERGQGVMEERTHSSNQRKLSPSPITRKSKVLSNPSVLKLILASRKQAANHFVLSEKILYVCLCCLASPPWRSREASDVDFL
jgi:hypothetical protein